MCYDISYLTKASLKYAQAVGKTKEEIEDIEKQMDGFRKKYFPESNYHTSGFEHKNIFAITKVGPIELNAFQWGLIPFWCRDGQSAKKLQNQTINARAETMFEKPSFKGPAVKRRCLIIVDNFFEHHHFKKKTYPFLIRRKDNAPMLLAGLWDTWVDKATGEEISTVSIVTTRANTILAKVHNNPKLKEPRMPLILPKESASTWLSPIKTKGDKTGLEHIINPFPGDELEYFTVKKLRGKEAVGNNPEALEGHTYPELILA